MRLTIPGCFLLLFATVSCTSYQYVSLNSDLPQKEDGKQYYYESEELYLAYDFNGENMPIFLYMENLSDRDVFLDLKRSMFLENNQIVRDLTIKETTRTVGVDSYGTAYKEYGTRRRPEEVRLIPPGKILKLKYKPFAVHYEKDKKQLAVQTSTVGLDGTGRPLGIAPYGSERDFEIRLIFSHEDSFDDEWVIDTHFRPDYIYYTEAVPENFVSGRNANLYYSSVTKGKAFGSVLGVLGLGFLYILALSME